jgi:hypothetical protein
MRRRFHRLSPPLSGSLSIPQGRPGLVAVGVQSSSSPPPPPPDDAGRFSPSCAPARPAPTAAPAPAKVDGPAAPAGRPPPAVALGRPPAGGALAPAPRWTPPPTNAAVAEAPGREMPPSWPMFCRPGALPLADPPPALAIERLAAGLCIDWPISPPGSCWCCCCC